MKTIEISVKDKVATAADRTVYICGNSDYVVNFHFDTEWDAYDTKTARFVYNGIYQDQVFQGTQCPVPAIVGASGITVGVFAGNISTTTPAYICARRSILCGSGVPADPAPDVYAQIMELIQGLGEPDPETIAAAVADYIRNNPIAETDPTVPAWAKAENKPEYTAEEVGALSADALPGAIDQALAQAKESGEFDGADGAPGADGYTPVKGTDYFTEADKQEIAEQAAGLVSIPNKLPNPNALTFTGAVTGSYDGSAPLSVEIPQGGGGGSVETYTGEYELIVDHTVTAEEASASSFTFTKDAYPLINGQKLLVLVIEMPDTVSMPWSVLKAGNDDVIWNFNGTANCIRGFSAVLYNRWFFKSEFLTNKNVDTYLPATIAIIANRDPSFRSNPYKEYTSITLYSYVAFLAEGTVIKIYGGK